jgi:2-dehydropantoate 2-reductase
MKIAVIGSGGVGGYFGARLAASGSSVTFVARGRQFAALKRNGLSIQSSRGNLHLEAIRVVEDIAKVGPVDLAVIAVKLWDIEEVGKATKSLVDEGASVLSLQNGVEKDDVLRRYLPAEAVLGAVCYISAEIGDPGVIRHSGIVQQIIFGEYSGKTSQRSTMFLEACRQATIDAEISDSIERLIWQKFVFLVGLSGTTTMRQSIGSIRENERTRSFLLDLMREVVEVGRTRGVALDENFAQEQIAFCDTLPASMTSSMHRDLEQGHRLELPWLSGGVVRLGKMVGIETPLNRSVTAILEPFVRGRSSSSGISTGQGIERAAQCDSG